MVDETPANNNQTQNPISENPRQSAAEMDPPSLPKIAGRTHGGRRPGAGAPKGNMNAFKHGQYSARHRRLVQIFASIPEVRDALIDIGIRRRRQQRLAEAGASEILAGLLQRAGEIVLNPGDNHAGDNQELLNFLRTMEAGLLALSKTQSREAAKIQRSIKRAKPGARSPEGTAATFPSPVLPRKEERGQG